jgi:peptidoglycan/xylan/chitin deacetylase (PgdA/CDA1 family)
LLSKIVAGGHEIGNHSFVHSNGKQPGFLKYRKDVLKCQRVILECCGIQPRLFRPPKGVISLTTLIVPKLVGLQTMTWSIDVQDWRCKNLQDSSTAAKKIIEIISPGDIILLHDDNPYVVTILEELLPVLHGKGIEFSKALYQL